jgi:hypothetical protein
MVGRLTLDQEVGVRIPAPQPQESPAPVGMQIHPCEEIIAGSAQHYRVVAVVPVDDEGTRLLDEWPSVLAEIESAVSDFAVKANRSARRFWL